MRYARIPIICLIFWIFAQTATAQQFHDLTRGEWDIEASDGRNTWNSSTLSFTEQEALGPFHRVEGFFFWIGSGGQYGREHFRGSYMPDGTIQLQGFRLEDDFQLGTAFYQARVEQDGRRIEGSWSGNNPGGWTASR